MNIRKLVVLLCGVLLVWACKTTRVVRESVSARENAISAGNQGNFELAVQSWQVYFTQQNAANQVIPAEDLVRAAGDALQSDKEDLAIGWYENAQFAGYSGADMYLAFASFYGKQNNLSRELSALEKLQTVYPDIAENNQIPRRLFDIYMEADHDKAFAMWSNLNKATRSEEHYLNHFFVLNKQKENNTIVDSVANSLLKLNPRHTAALEWNGEKYYWLAENRYQLEMGKYNKNRTHVQYTFLLNELKIVSEDFKKSRTYFDVLWEMSPTPRYATFLANIHSRLDNPDMAGYYKKFIEQ